MAKWLWIQEQTWTIIMKLHYDWSKILYEETRLRALVQKIANFIDIGWCIQHHFLWNTIFNVPSHYIIPVILGKIYINTEIWRVKYFLTFSISNYIDHGLIYTLVAIELMSTSRRLHKILNNVVFIKILWIFLSILITNKLIESEMYSKL